MATAPTTAEIQEHIFNFIRSKDRQPRSGEIAADLTSLQIYLQQNYGIRSSEYEDAVNGLIQSGELGYKNGSKFLMMTDSGFARL